MKNIKYLYLFFLLKLCEMNQNDSWFPVDPGFVSSPPGICNNPGFWNMIFRQSEPIWK
jgi:hypothetical protein